MSGPNEWGDDVALALASNVLGVDIILIPAFKESAQNRDLGITIIWCIKKTKHEPLYLFYYSESDFSSPHFQSIFPRSSDNVVKQYLVQNDDRGSLTDSASVVVNLTEESLQDIPIVMDDVSFQSIQVIAENPVSVMSQQVVPQKRGRGRPPGSKNKPKSDTSRPSCPEPDTSQPGPSGGRGRPGRRRGSKNKPQPDTSRPSCPGGGRGRGRGRGLESLNLSHTMSRLVSRSQNHSPPPADVSYVEEARR